MLPGIDLPRALLRGRYMAAAACIEHNGVPVDVEPLGLLRENWAFIQDQLIAEIDVAYRVYDGRTFKRDRFAAWLEVNGMPWARLESGELDSATTRSGRQHGFTRRSRPCGNSAVRSPSSG